MIRRLLYPVPVALALAFPFSPATSAELDLERAVNLALERNPALAAVEELRGQVAGGILEARADAFPQVSLVGAWGQSRSPAILNSPDFEGFLDLFPGGTFRPATQELTSASFELSQPLWTFGKVGAAIELARVAGEVAEAQIATARLDTAMAAAEAYYRVLAAREGLATVAVEQEFRREDLERVASLLEIGEATELELLRARAALAEVDPELQRRTGQVAVAEARFRQVLALAPDEPLELAAAPRAALVELAESPELSARPLEGRPELEDLALQERVYDRHKAVLRAEGRPQVNLVGSWGREVRRLESFDDPLFSSWRVGVGVRWELFDGQRRRGTIAQLESQRQQLALQREDLESRLRLDLDQALSDYRTARARAEAADTAAAAAGEALRVARESYREGVATQSELLDAQSRAAAADLLAVEAFYDALIRSARLARALGEYPTAGKIGPTPRRVEP
jgi:outer membrane protein TolC